MPKIKDRHNKKKVKNYHFWIDLDLAEVFEEYAKTHNRTYAGQFRQMIQELAETPSQ